MRSLVTLPRAVFVVAPLVIVGTLIGQTRQGGTAADEALRALNQGRYQEIDQLLAGQTDARAFALRGRALIEQGRYADAEKLLAGPAKAQPTSDAALEFGLLQLIVGRRAEATQTLRRVLSLEPRTAAENLRLARAAVALARETSSTELFKEANERYFRQAERLAPGDPVINAEWGLLFLEKYEAGRGTEVIQDCAQVGRDQRCRTGRPRAPAGRAEPAEREGGHRAGAEGQSEFRARPPLCCRERARRSPS